MKVLVMSDAHILRDETDGSYWCNTAVHGYDFWKRYLSAFDAVNVVARTNRQDTVDRQKCIRADGPGVRFIELPFVRGASAYVKNYFHIKRLMRNIITDEECGVFRLPSLPTFMLLSNYRKLKRPYAIEVIIDPEDGYQENSIAKNLLKWKLRHECLRANGVSYVTKDFLQGKYPSHSIKYSADAQHFDSYYSSINLSQEFFGAPRKYEDFQGRALKIIHVTSAINTDIKGHTTLLNAVKLLGDYGIPYELACIGDGDKRKYYEEMSKSLGIAGQVRFLGLFSKKSDLRDLLLNSDIKVFPSKAEGLPRVLIEAMATGLPCLSTPVNGIPELLDSKYLFDPLDAAGFASKLRDLYNNPQELEEMSNANFVRAKDYVNTVLDERRKVFYSKLRSLAKDSGVHGR